MLRTVPPLPLILALAFMLACSSEQSKDEVEGRPTATAMVVPTTMPPATAKIVVDASMSEELQNALLFLQLFLDLPPRQDVAPDDMRKWCLSAVNPMAYYSDAPDPDKAPIVKEHWERLEQHIFNCLEDPEYKGKHMLVGLYYDAQDGFGDMKMAPDIKLALHRLDLMYAVREYRFTLEDITDECFDAYYGESSSALRKCYATRLISDIPFMEGYQYDHVRSLME